MTIFQHAEEQAVSSTICEIISYKMTNMTGKGSSSRRFDHLRRPHAHATDEGSEMTRIPSENIRDTIVSTTHEKSRIEAQSATSGKAQKQFFFVFPCACASCLSCVKV